MTYQNTPLPPRPESAGLTCHEQFRLGFMDLNKEAGHAAAMRTAIPTAEFPVLHDPWCNSLVVEYVLQYLRDAGTTPERSNVPFQGWCERAARAAGMTNVTMPHGVLARWKLRYTFYGRFARLILD